jgi:hypothetical protein
MALVSVPAFAADPCPNCQWDCLTDTPDCHEGIITQANVIGGNSGGGGTGGGDPMDGAPLIKCKWEYDLDVLLDPPEPCCPPYCPEHDACPYEPGLQVHLVPDGDVKVGYYAIITDPQGVQHIDRVYADVWHPNGQFKYQFELLPIGLPMLPDGSWDYDNYDDTLALAAWAHVKSDHSDLITYNSWEVPEGWSLDDDILWELEEEEAYLYYGEALLNYCQPGGSYTVGIRAYDGLDMWSPYLLNWFWYIPTAAVYLDFDYVNYGDVVECIWQQKGGDKDILTSGKPTVKNIGNVPVFFEIWQDDMNFGKTGDLWNVQYKARLSNSGVYTDPFDPEEGEVFIPGFLGMCTEEKFDFLIHVIKGFPDGVPNEGIMKICAHIYGVQEDWVSPLVFDPAPQGVPQTAPP